MAALLQRSGLISKKIFAEHIWSMGRENRKMHLALFDFDGTISTKDTILNFIHFSCKRRKVFFGYFVLMPVLILYGLKLLSHHKAKEIMLGYYFGGWDKSTLIACADRYSEEVIPNIIRPAALERIKWHLEQKHNVVVVSGSLDILIGSWCKERGLDLICTELDFSSDTVTGKLASNNCFAEEKPIRIKEKYFLEKFSHIYAYGDSSGDRAMMSLAHESHYRPFES
jgi:HAD superfamily hydrolase (TIGR01490 family)